MQKDGEKRSMLSLGMEQILSMTFEIGLLGERRWEKVLRLRRQKWKS